MAITPEEQEMHFFGMRPHFSVRGCVCDPSVKNLKTNGQMDASLIVNYLTTLFFRLTAFFLVLFGGLALMLKGRTDPLAQWRGRILNSTKTYQSL